MSRAVKIALGVLGLLALATISLGYQAIHFQDRPHYNDHRGVR